LPETEKFERITVMGKENRFSPEVKERAVRLVYELQKESDLSQWAIICPVATKIWCTAEHSGAGFGRTRPIQGNGKV